MGVEYKKCTLDELKALVNQRLKAGQVRAANVCADPIYDRLFAGLDFTLLNLMCVQVRWSLETREGGPFLSAMRRYADKIIALIPVWKRLSVQIAAQGEFFVRKNQEIRLAAARKDTESVRALFEEVKKRFQAFDSGVMTEATTRQSDLANFIMGELEPVVADKKRWTECGLERCLSNDAFIGGTEASLYNAKTLFSFVTQNICQCIVIIEAENAASSASVLFTLDGQAGVWNCTAGITKRLLLEINEFTYI